MIMRAASYIPFRVYGGLRPNLWSEISCRAEPDLGIVSGFFSMKSESDR